MNKLLEFKKNKGMTEQQLSSFLGIPFSTVAKYVQGVIKPGIKNALLIEKKTEGYVTVDYWINL